ncbi:MAG: FAD-dependent monooxygenase [Steroidobacteraceae bacterium]|jgi:3-(3-hydroxy-phenyl)propionate hydroxylase|nr:FAD-dependent monooxygenase [Steroidobacteraceae bacterium]
MQSRIIVVGAGPVGLTCAALLAREGIATLVLEATPERGRDLRASTWHPPTLDLVDTLGLAQPLIERGLVSPTWQIRMHPSGERAVFDLALLAGETRHPFRLQCEQQVYCELLEARLARADCTIRRGAEVVALRQGRSAVEVDVRTAAGLETLSAEWLVGADGAKSTVRRTVGLELQGSTYPETTILATTTFPFEQHLEGLSNVNYCWSPEGTFSLLRLPSTWRVSLYPDADESIEAALEPASIQAKLQRIVRTEAPYVVTEMRPYRIHQRIVDTYRAGRVLLAGDSAHLNSPSGGMGMNGGLHDAFNLAEKLARVCRGEDDALLDLYVRQRRPVAAEQILAQAHRNRSRMQERNPAKRRAALDELLATVADPARAREYLLQSSMIVGLRRSQAIA